MKMKPIKRIIKTGTSYTAVIHGCVRHCTVATFEDGTTDLVAICDIISRDGQNFLRRERR
jgi:hypothetical protein